MPISERRFRQILREETQVALADIPTTSLNPHDGEKDTGLATSVKKGIVKGGTRFATKKALRFTLDKGLNALGLATKSIPGIGSIVALVDAGATFAMLLKDMKDFTDDLLKFSKVELSGVRSLLGEYSIFDASPEDMRKVAAGLRQNMTEEQRLELVEHWEDVMDGMKELIVDVLLTIKEFTFEMAIPVALAIKILPVETPVKNFAFSAVKFLNQQPEAVQLFLKVAKYANLNWLIPVVGFFADYDRVSAFVEIDEVITHEADPGRSKALKGAGRIAQKGTEMHKYIGMIGDEIADDVASALAKGSLMESSRRDRILLIENEIDKLQNRLARSKQASSSRDIIRQE